MYKCTLHSILLIRFFKCYNGLISDYYIYINVQIFIDHLTEANKICTFSLTETDVTLMHDLLFTFICNLGIFLFIFSSPCQRQRELLPSLGVRRLSFVNVSHFNLFL
jgi:hypothetical protein